MIDRTEAAENQELQHLSASGLAYLGDCVYELFVREYLVKNRVQHPSVEALKYVTAKVQSNVAEKIIPFLTEEEEAEYRRGRNIGHSNVPKSSTVAEYRRATGLETLFGWLYMSGKHDRLRVLFEIAFTSNEEQSETEEKEEVT